MAIQYAILGLLSWRPLSGYDLKKIMSESRVFYWSGNNNQIYRTLVQMHKEGLVDLKVKSRGLPAKKVYTITKRGLGELRAWVLSKPELAELRNTFLIQLAWADPLIDEKELDGLLEQYEQHVEAQLRVEQDKARKRSDKPDRTRREAWLWDKITDNLTSRLQSELAWVRRTRKELHSGSVA